VEDLNVTVNESTVLREEFGRKGAEVRGEWRMLYSEELHSSYCSPGIIRVIG
jgi:hypothetical protein